VQDDDDLGPNFSKAFIYPFSGHRWRSRRGRAHWQDLEGWQDRLAGPVSSVVKCGGCAYVYFRDDEYFEGVDEPAALRKRLRGWHNKIVEGLDRFVPASTAEAADAASMRLFASEMWAVVEQAIGVESARWRPWVSRRPLRQKCNPAAAKIVSWLGFSDCWEKQMRHITAAVTALVLATLGVGAASAQGTPGVAGPDIRRPIDPPPVPPGALGQAENVIRHDLGDLRTVRFLAVRAVEVASIKHGPLADRIDGPVAIVCGRYAAPTSNGGYGPYSWFFVAIKGGHILWTASNEVFTMIDEAYYSCTAAGLTSASRPNTDTDLNGSNDPSKWDP
jgi:hypothetical protein